MINCLANHEALSVNDDFYTFINNEVLPLTSLNQLQFWSDFNQLVDDFSLWNHELREDRNKIQEQINKWHKKNTSQSFDINAYKAFLKEIGYLVEEADDFNISTLNVDDEIAKVPGPQLVVPVKNARFALNAANARWGSLYDALYGSDVIPRRDGLEPGRGYNVARGGRVVEYSRDFLDRVVPLNTGSHHDVTTYQVYYQQLLVTLKDGTCTGLREPGKFVAFNGPKSAPGSILLKNNGLHIEIQIDWKGFIGSQDMAGINDILIEAATTTIMDCEDSVAAVDAEDKIEVYRNWLGLMQGTLEARFDKHGETYTRKLNKDRVYTAVDNEQYHLPGKSLLLIRNVGHLMDIDIIKDKYGNDIPEGILDGVITALIASIDLPKQEQGFNNSRTGSIYIVKPKMHGPEEVDFTCQLFSRIEDMLSLARNTIKIGIMDEERRTTINLKECIRVAKERLVFINTGFLDRTGDEIHTSMFAGPFLPKRDLKTQPWIAAYENWNVDIGLECGLPGKAQIGKGMWSMPDEMAAMVKAKVEHPEAGANTAWVPSPTAAVLHALHYHEVDVFAMQEQHKQRVRASLDDILTIPLLTDPSTLSDSDIETELEDNIHGILGYVVRWVEKGIGCSKVMDINNIGLMEDRATLRISSQHIGNWLQHGLCSEDQVMDIMLRMAKIVDQQNYGSPDYHNMSPDVDRSLAFQAARDLIFKATQQPNGYVEPLLHAYRKKVKKQAAKQD